MGLLARALAMASHWLRADENAATQRLIALNDGMFKQALDAHK